MSPKIMMAVGGTGGHIYPALGLAEEIIDNHPNAEITFVGGGFKNLDAFSNLPYAVHTVSCSTIRGRNPWKIGVSGIKIIRGVVESRSLIKKLKPDVVVGFGSFYSLPPLLAAKWAGVPFFLHEANSIPGKAIKWMSRWADAVGIHFPETAKCLKGNCIEVGMPLRKGYKRGSVLKNQACEKMGLSPNLPTILVFGGSQGAQFINEYVPNALCRLGENQQIQILHFTGQDSRNMDEERVYRQGGLKAIVRGYCNEMGLAWQSADLAICRSGAGTVAEQLEFEVPALYIPYPKATEDHQFHNARFVVDVVQGAFVFSELNLSTESLVKSVRQLLQEEDVLRQGIKSYKEKKSQANLYTLVMKRFTYE